MPSSEAASLAQFKFTHNSFVPEPYWDVHCYNCGWEIQVPGSIREVSVKRMQANNVELLNHKLWHLEEYVKYLHGELKMQSKFAKQ